MTLLLIEDNQNIIEALTYTFEQNKYKVISKTNTKDAKQILKENNIDIIILDISLPDGNGIDLYKNNIKELNIPTIFLTANDDEEIIVDCLKTGAEDYITKPFKTKELIARIEKILMRKQQNTIIEIQNLKFDIDKMQAYKNNKEIELTSLEIKILHLLMMNKNKTVRRNTIIEKIWDWTGNDIEDNTVTVYLKRIREKLGVDIIKTVKGIGYRIDDEK
jgi:DNA-binding response OmpR family regulator